MKPINTLLLIIIGAVAFYVVFLLVSDFSTIHDKIYDFNYVNLPIILSLIPLGWFLLFIRWNILLKNIEINIPLKNSFEIFISGFALTIIPGKVGELIKAQILKTKFGIARKKTAPIVIVENYYNIVGIIIISLLGMWFFEFSLIVLSIAAAVVSTFTLIILSKKSFNKSLSFISKIKYLHKYSQILVDAHEILVSLIKNKKIFLLSSALTALFWLTESLTVFFVLRSFGIDSLSMLVIIPTYTTSIILGVVSFLPLGLGVVEGSLTGFLSHLGIEFPIAVTAVVFIRIFTRWISIIAGFIALKQTKILSQLKNNKE